MATSNTIVTCYACQKETTTYSCPGCSQYFCVNDLMKHREELKLQFHEIENHRNEFLQSFDDHKKNENNYPVFNQIIRWEQRSIEEIRQTANEQRQLVQQSIYKHTKTIETKLNTLSDEMRGIVKREDFNEIVLNKLRTQLGNLRKQLNQSNHIQIKEDSSSPYVNKISVIITSTEDILPNQPFQFENLPPKTSPITQSTKSSSTTSKDTSIITKKSSNQPSTVDQKQDNTDVSTGDDSNSPFYAMTTFEELKLQPDLLKGIFNMGFQKPSKIQSVALPRLLDNPPKNVIAQSQPGTGKTTSFSLVILSRIDPTNQSPQALILAPTFELAIQIGSVIERMAHFLPYIKIAYAVRDPNYSKRNERFRGKLISEPIVIGTLDTVEEWYIKLRMIDLSKLRMCCIDELDFMIAHQGFQENCMRLVHGLNRSQCQMK